MTCLHRLILAALLVLSFSAGALAQNCPSYPGDYQLNFDPSSKKMVVCKYNDSLRDVCSTNTGTTCTAAQAGSVTFDTASNRLRFCNGTNWMAMTCGTISTCSNGKGFATADATYAKYCDGTNWHALHNTGTCDGIGVLEATFNPTTAMLGDRPVMFGSWDRGLAMTSNYLFAGIPEATTDRVRQGTTAIYKRSGTSWNFLKLVHPSVQNATARIGYAVTSDGTWLVIGGWQNRIYIYNKDQGGTDNWGLVKTYSVGGEYGVAVDLKGDLLIVGARNYQSSASYPYQGRAYVYRRDQGGTNNWGQSAILENPESPPTGSPVFGSEVTIAGDIAVVGAYGQDESYGDDGAVYLFQKSGTDTWNFLKKIVRPDASTAAGDNFGLAVDVRDIDGNGTADRMVVGAPYADKFGGNAGMVYIYDRNQGGTNNWGLVKEAGDTAGGNYAVGNRVALNAAGDTIMAGARVYDGPATDAGGVAIFQKDQGGTNNWGLVNYLTASDATTYDELGRAVAFDGNYVASTALYAEGTPYPGAVYVFFKSGSAWAQQAKLTPPTTGFTFSPRMGDSVAVSGEYAVTGMVYHSNNFSNSRRNFEGAVNIYRRSIGGNWTLEKTVMASAEYSDAVFGYSLDTTPEFLLVASPADGLNGGQSGAGWLFGRNQGGTGNWGEIKRLKASDSKANLRLGDSNGVGIDGGTAVLGAWRDDLDLACPPSCDAGSAYVFDRDQGGNDNWGQVKKLLPSVQEAGADFGYSTDVALDTIVVGAHVEDANGSNAGAAYIFYRNQGGTNNWGQIKRLIGEVANDQFGFDVSVSDNTIAVGARYQDGAGSNAGAVYIYERDLGGANNWGLRKRIDSPGTTNGDFGSYIDLSGDILIVGAPVDDTNGADAGRVYVFKRHQGGTNNWGLLSAIDSSDPQPADNFGSAVAVSGNVLAVGNLYMDGPTGNDSGGALLYGCP